MHITKVEKVQIHDTKCLLDLKHKGCEKRLKVLEMPKLVDEKNGNMITVCKIVTEIFKMQKFLLRTRYKCTEKTCVTKIGKMIYREHLSSYNYTWIITPITVTDL